MSEEKKKIELTEEQLEKIAAGESTARQDWTVCPNCHSTANCWIMLPEFEIFDINCPSCGYYKP